VRIPRLSDRYRDPIVRKLGLVALLALLAAPATAAAVQPRLLVLHKSDVPRGYKLDDTELLGNPGPGATASFRDLAKRSGRVTGYYVHFLDGSKEITAVAELFRKPAGAKIYLAWYERRLRLQGEKVRTRVAIGDTGWAYDVHSTPNSTFVLWRDGRVVSSVLTHAMSGGRALAVSLAQKQDRRAGAALELPPTR
jgi:hypothetical protein